MNWNHSDTMHHKLTPFPRTELQKNGQKGQISFFFIIGLSICITLLAFIINVGLFIKAKINLQNAVDAAAWSGAAVQARNLTDIGYLNWEMRNAYKEWMFKYYVLGNLSAPGVKNPGKAGNNLNVNPGGMDFTLGPAQSVDQINVPSICIHQRSRANDNDVCSIYKIPGLPRLGTPTWGSLDETTSVYVDVLSQVKSKDCSERSKANFLIALSWAYGTGVESNNKVFFDNFGSVAANRPGAWVQEMELAIRIRNLETLINTKPKNQGICADPSQLPPGTLKCGSPIQSIEAENNPGNERSVKAFYSAYRNLGNDSDREMKDSFVLTELSPRPYVDQTEGSLSTLLSGSSQAEKYYLDLKLYSLNLAYFYSLLATVSKSGDQSTYGVGTDAECQMVKMAIPIPGYPLGFEKNPRVLTYYAVKGEAAFQGLFNPFAGQIILTAYSAARPFGARIGPKLFQFGTDLKTLFARSFGNHFRSAPYLFGLNLDPEITGLDCSTNTETNNKCIPPIMPAESSFWATNATDIIGSTDRSKAPKYAVPNLYYDLPNGNNQAPSLSAPLLIYPIKSSAKVKNQLGLYQVDQYKQFIKNLEIKNEISSTDVATAIERARGPTLYETQNYLIPSPYQLNQQLQLDSFGTAGLGNGDGLSSIFAPIYAEYLPFRGPTEINQAIRFYLEQLKPSIAEYIKTLGNLADVFRNMKTESSTSKSGKDLYQEAANSLHDDSNNLSDLTCQSVAGKMFYFFYDKESKMTNSEGCPKGLAQELENLYGSALFNQTSNTRLNKNFHYITFQQNQYQDLGVKIFNGFYPGKLQGGAQSPDDFFVNPFSQAQSKSARNFYSSKFVSLQSLTNQTQHSPVTFAESLGENNTDEEGTGMINSLDLSNEPNSEDIYQ